MLVRKKLRTNWENLTKTCQKEQLQDTQGKSETRLRVDNSNWSGGGKWSKLKEQHHESKDKNCQPRKKTSEVERTL